MASRVDRFGWFLGFLLAGLAFGWMAGCASNDPLPLPPGGILSESTADRSAAAERTPAAPEAVGDPQTEQPAEPETAQTAAAAKKLAAAEKAQRREAEKQAAAEAKQAAAEKKAAEKLAKKEAKQAAAAAEKLAAAEKKRQQAEKKAAAKALRAQPKDWAAEPAKPEKASAQYVLQAGDEIEIQVYREPELSGTFKINPSGDVRHSLVGAVPMAGQTLEEAEAQFTRKLAKDYLVDPRVIFKLLSTQSSQIVLMGEVKKPGVYPLPFGETMTLLQAIAGAGGFTDLASPDRVRIVRRLPDGHQTTLKFRVSDLLGGRGKQQDVPLEPNDVIMVPEVLF